MSDEDLFVNPGDIDPKDHVLATYLIVSAAGDIRKRALTVAIKQSTGGSSNSADTDPQIRRSHFSKVVSISEAADEHIKLPADATRKNYIVEIAVPAANIGTQIPMLLSTVIGEIAMAGKIKLLDLSLPGRFLDGFGGPRFGIEGIRNYLGAPRRPLLANINKPFTGRTPEEGAKLFYQAALGGSDIIKDDELLGDSSYSKALSRAKLFMEMERRAFEETGERTIYAVNITDRPDRLVEKARRAVELGANGLMVNFLSVGISALSILAEDADVGVPILAHLDICGVMCGVADHGISANVLLGLLPRLAGADLVIYPCPYGLLDISRAEYLQVAEAHRAEMGDLKPTFPAPAGGVHAGMVEALTRDLGVDYIVGAGSSVHMHPMGAMCGARAFRQAIDATVDGVGLAEAAKEHEELRAAIDLWGVLPAPPA